MEKYHSILLLVAIILGVVALQTYLIQIIFNKVVIKKFPSANIKELSFWDALAISILCALLSSPQVINYCK